MLYFYIIIIIIIITITILKICCTESIYSVYKDKLQNCSCKQFE